MFTAELRKLMTTRTALFVVIGGIAVVALGALSTSASAPAGAAEEPLHAAEMFLLASINVGLFAAIVGIRSFTDEVRHGTLAWTVLSVRDRWRIVAAKSAVSALVAAVMALGSIAAMAGVAVSLAGAVEPNTEDLAAAAGLVAAAAMWAVIGTAVGTIVRHQLVAVVGAVIWVLAVENLAASFLGDVGRVLPGAAAHSVANASAGPELLPTTVGVVVLLGYSVALSVLAAISLERRELALAG